MSSFTSCCRLFCLAALLVGGAACEFREYPLPDIQKPLGYDTVEVSLPGCVTPLPPVRSDIECGAIEIGKSIDHKDVCHLLEALRTWVASGPADAPAVRPDDWSHVRAVCVRRGVEVTAAQCPAGVPCPPVHRSFLELVADAPNRSRLMTVHMMDDARTLKYLVGARDYFVLGPNVPARQ
jgi:hypothetical protein